VTAGSDLRRRIGAPDRRAGSARWIGALPKTMRPSHARCSWSSRSINGAQDHSWCSEIELFEELRRIAPGQAERLIFLSGGAFTAQAREQLAQLGALQLEKPVTTKELRASILRIANGPARS